ncbi:structural maintenance of chromosomes protein 3 isoform X2 [Halyomorpha halys]|uniref:structural maintenance of chromosomes protein 3 isoform X2 n=1 Tax=Halyomorpha halys TaxID=286706 RepID=UPI0034D1DDEF
MHIKNIIINNFKSFHGFNIIEDITPCHNVIVGDNGAGKSVFLQAIEFLLSFENKQATKGNIANLLSPRERKGFIEILFSGCDTLFENEITVKKEFSLITNIRFYVNGKRVDKKKMMALYEALSLNYMHSSFLMTPLMVQKFTRFSRKELLDYLMKNMGATLLKTYETIQKLFLVLEDQKGKIDNLLQLFQNVKTNDGKNDLIILKKHKKIKNDILKEILKKKIKKLFKLITQLEDDLSSLKRSTIDDNVSSTISLLHYSCTQIEAALYDKQSILNNLIEENCKLVEKKEKIHLSSQDITKTISLMKKWRDETSKFSVESQSEEKIKFISEDLDSLKKEVTSKKQFLTELSSQKKLKEGMRLNLLSKIQRTKDFQSKEGRNSQLQVKVDSMSEQIHNMEEEVNILSIRKEELLRTRQFTTEKIENVKKQLLEQEESFGQNIFRSKQLLNSFFDSMCDIRREERILEDEIAEISLNIQEKGLELKKKIGSAIVIGSESLLSVIEACKNSESYKWLSDGYYGMVIENFECPEELSIAVESAIGNRLFAHIVSNNKIATNILKEINNHKLPGEILFLPINNLIETYYDYPTSEVSKSVMSGGYFSNSKCSKILFSKINHLQENKALKTEELDNVHNKINELETKINRSISYNQQLKKEYSNNDQKKNLQRLIDDEKHASQELIYINGLIENKKYSVRELRVSQRMLIDEISEDFEEINEKVNSEIIFLNKEIKEYEKILHDKNIELATLESKKLKLENDLIHQRKLKDSKELDISEIKTYMKKLKDYQVKEEVIDNRIKLITNKIKENEKSITELISEKIKLEEDIKECSELDISVGRRDKITQKIMLYNNKISEYKAVYNKINKSSSQPNEYSEFTLPMLYDELKNVNKILKADLENSEINRRSRKINHLYKKYERLHNDFTNNYVIYSHFVEWLHSYIEQCLNNVSDNFAEFFESLTSGGIANLFLDSDESSGSWPALENITGLQMCVQFPNSAVTWNLMDLSFGQSSLVALAFKFSIIKSFLISIFIMDEIDRPLEHLQKKLVCHHILTLEGKVQTFTASHSQEWITIGKNVYHITFEYTGSNVKKLTQAEVAHFLNERRIPDTESYRFVSGWDTVSSSFT